MSVRVPVSEALESNCRIVFELWDSLRGDHFAPSWKDFDLQRLPPREISFTRVIDVHHNPFNLVYRFWGTGLVTVLGIDRTGKSLTQTPMERGKYTQAEYEAVIQEKAPYALVYNAKSELPAIPHYAPAIRLPLTDDGKTVDKIVSYADFNADKDKWERLFEEKQLEAEKS